MALSVLMPDTVPAALGVGLPLPPLGVALDCRETVLPADTVAPELPLAGAPVALPRPGEAVAFPLALGATLRVGDTVLVAEANAPVPVAQDVALALAEGVEDTEALPEALPTQEAVSAVLPDALRVSRKEVVPAAEGEKDGLMLLPLVRLGGPEVDDTVDESDMAPGVALLTPLALLEGVGALGVGLGEGLSPKVALMSAVGEREGVAVAGAVALTAALPEA